MAMDGPWPWTVHGHGLAGWLAGWLVVWLAGWLVVWLAGVRCSVFDVRMFDVRCFVRIGDVLFCYVRTLTMLVFEAVFDPNAKNALQG